MKTCSRCGITKNTSEFGEHRRYADGLNCWCKDCVREYARQSYKNRRAYYKEYQVKHGVDHKRNNRTWHQKKRERLNSFKKPCAKCGDDRLYLVDFHHIDPNQKKGNLADFCLKVPDEELESEIKKCICLCRNCHFEFHYLYGNKPLDAVGSLTEYLGGNPYEV